MGYRFQIEFILKIKGRVYVLTHYLGKEAFTLSCSSTLGGVPLECWLAQPRKIKPSGTLDTDAFVFALKDGVDETKMQVGQEVELQT